MTFLTLKDCRFKSCRLSLAVLMLGGVFCPGLFAQGLVPDTPQPLIEATSTNLTAPVSVGGEHRFWDKENRVLFATSAALSAADFAVTRSNLQNGGRDLNPVVRFFGPSTAGLAVNFAGETLGVMGVSYLFHRTGHHKLERIFTVVNIGCSAGAVGYDLALR